MLYNSMKEASCQVFSSTYNNSFFIDLTAYALFGVIITEGKDITEDIENLYSILKGYGDSNGNSNAISRRARTEEIGGQEVVTDFHWWLGYERPKIDKDNLAKSILNAVRDEALKLRKNSSLLRKF